MLCFVINGECKYTCTDALFVPSEAVFLSWVAYVVKPAVPMFLASWTKRKHLFIRIKMWHHRHLYHIKNRSDTFHMHYLDISDLRNKATKHIEKQIHVC